MKNVRLAILILAVLLLTFTVAGCGSADEEPVQEPTQQDEPAEQSPTPEPQAEDAGDGASSVEAPAGELAPAVEGEVATTSWFSQVSSSWVLDYMGEDDAQIAPLPDTHITLGFFPDRYGGDSGCNFYVGAFSQDGANVILETPARTRSFCDNDEELIAQENAFMSSLSVVRTYDRVDGKLKLYASNGQQLLTMAPMTPVETEGTVWKLRFINEETQYEEVIPGSEITHSIDGNTVVGNAGCNDYSGESSINEEGFLVISGLSYTEMACEEPAGVMAQEQLYLSKLEQVGLERHFPTTLQYLTKDGMPLLIYSADWESSMEETP